jgi:electron transport complex protein RnfD
MNADASEGRRFTVTPSPHLKAPFNVKMVMYIVVAALLPALGGAIYFFGLRALWLVLISVATAVLAEFLMNLAFKRPLDTCLDGSAVITGMLLAYNLPPSAPLWMPAVGSAFAIIIVKALFGGLGHNFLNPALAGRAFLMASWPGKMTSGWMLREGLGTTSGIQVDAFTGATPLGVVQKLKDVADPNLAETTRSALNDPSMLKSLFFGNVGGVLGETSVLLLLIPAIILIAVRVIDWRIPLAYIGTVALGTLAAWLFKATPVTPIFHLLSGGLMLGALFRATDYTTSPITPAGLWIFGIGCGILTVLIRLWGGYPEGVSYSILLMNVATPFIDRYTRPRILGEGAAKKERR